MIVGITLCALILWAASKIIFYFTHQKPLTDNEIKSLMRKRRKAYFNEYFDFKATNSYPEKTFKSSMRADGSFYNTNISVANFPSYVAHLLKGKKHEWVLFGFVKDDKVICLYTNKGNDGRSVSSNISTPQLIDFCKKAGCHSILKFHNHPNSDPQNYTCLLPSAADKRNAASNSCLASDNNINWVDFICERGNFIVFNKFVSQNSFPYKSAYEYIYAENQNSKSQYKLQKELGWLRR